MAITRAAYEMICKHRKELTEEELLQMALGDEDILKKRMRDYSIMNRDHWTMLMGTDPGSIKTKKVLKILKKESNNITADLNIANSYYKVKTDLEVFERLKQLIQENTDLNEQIKTKKKDIAETEDTIRKVYKTVNKLKGTQISDEFLTRKNMEGQKTVETLENKLDVQVKKFGSIMKKNRELREKIDHYLLERKSFDKMWERAISQLTKGKKINLDLIQQSTVAYNRRDELMQALGALRSKSYLDYVRDCEEMYDLQRKYDDKEKLANFMETKEQIRNMRGLIQLMEKKKLVEKRLLEEKTEQYMEIFSNIQQTFETMDTEIIARTFFETDFDIYANLRIILNLNGEIETEGDQLKNLVEKINVQQQLQESRTQQQTNKIEELKLELEEATEIASNAEAEFEARNKYLQQLYNEIERLFGMTRCKRTPFLELLHNNAQITNFNVLLYLDALQNQINDVVITALFKQRAERKKGIKTGKVTIIIKEERLFAHNKNVNEYVLINPCPLCVEQEMVSDVIDTLQFARTKEEVIEHLADRLALPDGNLRLHSVSACNLPKSREIIQRRYQ